MAVYAGSARRKRTTVVVAIAALIAGLLAGLAIGRATAPTIDEEIADGRNGGRDLVTALQVLPLEYGQAVSGAEGTALIGDTVERSVARLDAALDGAPWLGPAQRNSARAAVQAVKVAADDRVAPAQFAAVVERSSATLRSIFGLPAAAGG